jgi:hypothetical protein
MRRTSAVASMGCVGLDRPSVAAAGIKLDEAARLMIGHIFSSISLVGIRS